MKNFEHYTEKLTDKEKEILVPWFVKGLAAKVGKEKIISNPQIRAGMKSSLGIDVAEVQVRKIVAYIRDNDLLPGLVATQRGYYVTKNPEEVKEYIKSLESREAGFKRARLSMERYLVHLLNK